MAGKWLFFSLLLTCAGFAVGTNLKLTQVLIVSRHNLRTPLTETLSRMTPKTWPKWDKAVGQLTEKGALLESYMAEYISQWLQKEGLFATDCRNCPNMVHIYANTRQRTKETAIAFARAAFPNSNIKVNYKNITQMDPMFYPVVYNMTETYQTAVKQEMQEKLDKTDLRDAYKELNRITDIKNSLICMEDNYCDLAEDKDEILFEIGLEPNTMGPLFIGTSMVDAFMMSYYEGMPINDIAWGEIKTDEQWHLLTKLLRGHLDIRFFTSAAKDIAKPLLKYMKEKLDSGIEFTMLVGHDSNLSPILKSLEFKTYVLPEQLELTPIGAKLAFQKWTDGVEDYVKVEMIYQTMEQLRNGEKLSLDNPPMKVLMEMKQCHIDKNGFCPWNKFMDILNDLVK